MSQDAVFSDLVGMTIESIVGLETGSEEVFFTTTEGRVFRLAHIPDCCETVQVEDVCGDTEDLIGAPILQAEESTGETPQGVKEPTDSYTWTFYKLATIKGSVTIRWLGESNGWYSETVDFAEVRP